MLRRTRNPAERGSPDAYRHHETIDLTAVTIEITELTDDGRRAEATLRFRVPLENPSLRWLFVKDFRYVPFAVPGMSETAEVPSPLR